MSDSVKRKIRLALVSGLKTITKANNYGITIKEVHATPGSFENIRNFPSVNFNWGNETYQQGTHASGRLFKECFINLDFFFQDVNNLDKQRNLMIKAVEKYLLTNYFLPYAGVPTCNVTLLNSNKPWGIESTKIYGGITLELKVLYEQNLFDPYSVAQGTTPPHSEFGQATISLKEQLTGAIVYQLNQIKKSTGYNTYLYTDSDRDTMGYESIKNYPFANVIARAEDYVEQGQDRWVKKRLSYTIDVYLREHNKMNADIEDILADIESRLMNNYVLPDSAGNRTCTECYFSFNHPFGLDETVPAGGLQIGLDVYYRQDIDNPSIPSIAVPAVGGYGAGGYGENPWGY